MRTVPRCTFVPPLDYDFGKSTIDNYRQPNGGLESYGYYKDIRDTLDKAYHGAYTKGRQLMQDELVHQVVDPHKSQQVTPWIVFTAGAMGAGKSRTIKWMSQRNIFPLDDIVHIDSDIFKGALPEWSGYVARDPLAAGYHTRHESGYLVELAQEAALRLGKHIWVDGSLRDAEWYQGVFSSIRKHHPRYQIAILYVTADEAEIKQRVRKRAVATGRYVPDSEIHDSIVRVPQSVAALAPCAEFLAVIDNSDAEPHLTRYCEEDMCYLEIDRWEEIEKRFRSVPANAADRQRRRRAASMEGRTANAELALRAAATKAAAIDASATSCGLMEHRRVLGMTEPSALEMDRAMPIEQRTS